MNSEISIIIISIIALVTLLSGSIIAFVFRYRKRRTEFEQEKQQLIQERENVVNKARLEISEDLMKQISVEIHDNIGQSLSLAKLTLLGVDAQNFQEQNNRTTDILTRAISDLRNLSKSLNGNFIMDIGLEDAIKREAEIINNSGKLKCTFHSEIEHLRLDEQHEVILFRCIQEAMNNCIKHAKATEIHVTLTSENNIMTLIAKDNGIGFKTESNSSIGLGLQSMKQRIEIIGGKFHIKSSEGFGTELIFQLPLNSQPV